MTDWLPIVSQVKSIVQELSGDHEGAKRTQEIFLRECPGVSQVTSVCQLVSGDVDGAIETQKRCGKRVLTTADGIPAVGHAKGLIHYACGDVEGGNQAMKSATRTSAVMGGGVAGFVVGGPVGAVAGGVLAGGAADGTTTAVESVIRDEYTPSGYFAAVENVVKNPTSGGIFDLVAMPAFDGLTGYTAGQTYDNYAQAARIKSDIKAGKALEAKVQSEWANLEQKFWDGKMKEGDYLRQSNILSKKWNQAKVMQGESLLSEADIAIAEMKGKVVEQPKGTLPAQKTDSGVVPVSTEASEDQGKKKKRKKKKCNHRVKVFYVNARSINPGLSDKIGYLKNKIAQSNPDVVAIVETWLTDSIGNAAVTAALAINGYRLIRRDRTDVNPRSGLRRRGGGLIIAVREGRLKVVACTGAFKDNFLGIELRYDCPKCGAEHGSETIAFGLLYRRAARFQGENREDFNSHSDEMWEEVNSWVSHSMPQAKLVLLGDFNFKIDAQPEGDGIWPPNDLASRLLLGIPIYRGYQQYIPSATQRGLFDSLVDLGLQQVVEDATHTDGGILDLIFAHPSGFVDGSQITNMGQIAVGCNKQDHVILLLKLQFSKDYEE